MKKFTAEEIELLKQNPYTLYITSSRLNLTLAAEEQIVRLREKNHSYTLIMEELGYDLSIIGDGAVG